MSTPAILFAAWARSAVVAHGGGFRSLQAHDIAAPVLQAVLARAGVAPAAVDAVVLGNALGAGGNPARMAAFAAGLPDGCATFSVDTQCCAGLDAVALGIGLIRSGQAEVVLAGGVEAWSRSPIRQVRPLHPGEAAVPFERPPFCPDPSRDPDLLASAAEHAARTAVTRQAQDAYALASHAAALLHAAVLSHEIVPIAGMAGDSYPRAMPAVRAARLPVLLSAGPDASCGLSTLAISPKADGAAAVLLMSAAAASRLGVGASGPRLAWRAHSSLGGDPSMPLLAAGLAAQAVLQKAGVRDARALACIELHDAFAVQGLDFCRSLGLTPSQINRCGGGIARGHPIGASGAIALVRVLADLARDGSRHDLGMAAIAGAGGLGSATLVERLG
ncbi:beta-ketoacyl synthase N-terminal-like domain-containing protein [Variovorax sp. HJSM1_2]|uniref:thiolase family protein n=1 Tax=Variovorax sp. HJSM1_2 TaxID=3366263 RepID=UPI003BED5CA9